MRATPTTLAAALGGLLLLRHVARDSPQRRSTDFDAMLDDETLQRRRSGPGLLTMAALIGGGIYLSGRLRSSAASGAMSSIEESIELEVPVSTAYNQWTQFEDFPKFMATVEQVKQVDDTHLRWRAVVAGKTKEWNAEITEQLPDQRIAWRSTSGVPNAGVVTFHRISEDRCRVMLQMDYQPETTTEKLADAVGAVKMTAEGNLQRFKELVESRGSETGAWRGTVEAT